MGYNNQELCQWETNVGKHIDTEDLNQHWLAWENCQKQNSGAMVKMILSLI